MLGAQVRRERWARSRYRYLLPSRSQVPPRSSRGGGGKRYPRLPPSRGSLAGNIKPPVLEAESFCSFRGQTGSLGRQDDALPFILLDVED